MTSRRRNRVKSIFRSKPKFIGLAPRKPPMTTRFCMYCRCNREFKFNPHIHHSECIVCRSREARRKQ